jgi:prevent-host-death family protein
METIGLYEAKTRLSELVREAIEGETVIITRHGKPAVKLVPVDEAREPREMGFYAGKVRMAEDFDAPLDDFSEYR